MAAGVVSSTPSSFPPGPDPAAKRVLLRDSENRKGPPNTSEAGFLNEYVKVCKSEETRNL
jgi:hypothetical protein